MALRQYRPDLDSHEESIQYKKQAHYHEYQTPRNATNRLRDLLFFVTVVLFSIFSVISTYIYLSLNIPTFFAFLLGISTGFTALRFVQIFLRSYYKHLKGKK